MMIVFLPMESCADFIVCLKRKGSGLETVVHNTRAMANPYKTQVGEFGIPITDEQYKELRSYAVAHGIRITGFRNYVGDIETIKIIIDDISEIARDFPKILDVRFGVVLELDFDMNDDENLVCFL